MVVSFLLRLEETPNGLCAIVHWNGLDTDGDSLEPIEHVQEDVPELL